MVFENKLIWLSDYISMHVTICVCFIFVFQINFRYTRYKGKLA